MKDFKNRRILLVSYNILEGAIEESSNLHLQKDNDCKKTVFISCNNHGCVKLNCDGSCKENKELVKVVFVILMEDDLRGLATRSEKRYIPSNYIPYLIDRTQNFLQTHWHTQVIHTWCKDNNNTNFNLSMDSWNLFYFGVLSYFIDSFLMIFYGLLCLGMCI